MIDVKNTFENLKPAVVRVAITASIFLGMISFPGTDARVSQEVCLWVIGVSVLAFLFRNIWITLFMLWSAFLFCFFRFITGQVYLSNICWGAILYLATTLFFRKNHISTFLNILLWFVFINVVYMQVQLFKLDYIFYAPVSVLGKDIEIQRLCDPSGFMFYKSAVGMLCVIGMAILLARRNLTARLAGLGLIIPIFLTQSSICAIASFVLIIFNIWQSYGIEVRGYTIKRSWIIGGAIPFVLCGLLWFVFIHDNPKSSVDTRAHQYAMTFKDAWIHPITGWGLDSFRRDDLPWKNFKYCTNYKEADVNGQKYKGIDVWDNVHCLYLQIFYEWGVFGLLIIIGFFRQLFLWFQKSDKSDNVIALSGVMIAGAILSISHFPMFVARLAIIFVICAALYEVATRETI